MVWWEGTEWRAGEVRYMAEEQRWEDLIEVAPWEAAGGQRSAEKEGREIGAFGGTGVVVQGHEQQAVSVLGRYKRRQGSHKGWAVLCNAGGESAKKKRCQGAGSLPGGGVKTP